TLGVAVIGSIYASLYASELTTQLGARLPSAVTDTAHSSVGAAFGVAERLSAGGQPQLAAVLHSAASDAFFNRFQTACPVAASVSGAGAVFAALWLPNRPPQARAGPDTDHEENEAFDVDAALPHLDVT